MQKDHYDVVVVGTGAAGLSAALYTGRYRMNVLVVGGKFGGETSSAGVIYNYPGVKDIDGYDLMKIMKEQAESVGAEIIDGFVEKIEKRGACFFVNIKDKSEIRANTVIFATGTERKKLGLPNEEALRSKGIHYCTTCDGPLYVEKTIIVVGGGDAAIKGANLSAEYASKIYILARGNSLRAEPINLERMKAFGGKITILYETEVKEIIGTNKFEKIKLSKPFNGSDELSADGLFVEIGAEPDITLPNALGITLDEHGYIKANALMQTNIEGIYVAGDAVNLFGTFKQDITAACMGAVAATSAYNFRKIHGDLCEIHSIPIKSESAVAS